MKPVVGELVFCSGKYCRIIFICNVIFGVLIVLFNSTALVALLRITKHKGWKLANVILFAMVLVDLCTGLICQPLHAYFVLRQKNVYNEADLGYLEAWLFFALNYSSYVFCCASLLIAALLALERLSAVKNAVMHRTHASLSRTVSHLLVTLFISLVVPIFRFITKHTRIVFMVLLVLIVLIALCTVVTAYIMLFRSFRFQRIATEKMSSTARDKIRGLKQERRLAKTFALLTAILVFMYLPQMLLKPISIMIHIKKGSSLYSTIVILEDAFNTVLYSNSAVNPLVYFSRHDAARQELWSFLPRCKRSTTANITATTSRHKEPIETISTNKF